MVGILETYDKLIGQMLKQLPSPSPQTAETKEQPGSTATITPAAGAAGNAEAGAGGNVREELTYLLKMVQELKRHCYQEQEKFLRGLQGLRHIQVERHPPTLRKREKLYLHGSQKLLTL